MDAKKSDSVQTTISIEDLTDCLREVFKAKPPSPHLVQALFHRFKPLKVVRDQEGLVRGDDMDIVDFLLACNLLSRVK